MQPQYGQQQPQYGQPQYGQPVYGQPVQPQYQQPQYGAQPQYQQVPANQQYAAYTPNTNEQAAAPLVVGSKEERFQYAEGQWRDKCWALLFFLHLGGMGAVAAILGPAFTRDMNDDNSGGGGIGLSPRDQRLVILILGAAALAAAVFAAFWLGVMQRYADSIIKCSLVMVVVMQGAWAAYFLIRGVVIGAVIFVLFALLNLLYFYLVRHRIPFAQATIAAAAKSIQENPGTVYVAYGLAAVQVVWLFFWSFCFMSVYHALYGKVDPDDPNRQPNNMNNALYFVLLVSLYWTAQVLKNVGHVTTAGAVAQWWFQPGPQPATCPAFKRATTTSLGSICLGSLIVAVLKALRAMIRAAEQNARRSNNAGAVFILCCASCILGCIERAVQYFNMYAFTQVAIYGKDFVTAAKDTWELFKSRGFDLLINDDLTGMVLAIGCLCGGAAAGIVASLWGVAADFRYWYVVAAVAFVLGFVMTALVMAVVESAVATTFVCWAEDPHALAEGRPAEFQRLRNAAQALHPTQNW